MEKLWHLLTAAVSELFHGICAGTIPWMGCLVWGVFLGLSINFGLDELALRRIGAASFLPNSRALFAAYYLVSISSGVWIWAIYRAGLKLQLLRRLTNVFRSIGLKNSSGQLPQFISDLPIDAYTRKLRLRKRSLSLPKFREAKDAIESSLHVFIDEMRDNREAGSIDIIYAHEPMPEFLELDNPHIKKDELIVGATRSGNFYSDFEKTPHLLVAGQTGGGKSTCIRQWITSLYLSNPSYKFSLIDLKAGLEFQIFEKLPRIEVIPSVSDAVIELESLAEQLRSRMAVLKANNCKDLVGYRKIPMSERKRPEKLGISANFDRHIVVIDEISELFLSGSGVSTKEATRAREVVSQIARLGRAGGCHLIIGTQRPDSRALDTQVKANLTGKICFQMADQHSSLVVLGNARAKDLPPIPGRAIWQNGTRQIEVQVPYLSVERTESLLRSNNEKEADACD